MKGRASFVQICPVQPLLSAQTSILELTALLLGCHSEGLFRGVDVVSRVLYTVLRFSDLAGIV